MRSPRAAHALLSLCGMALCGVALVGCGSDPTQLVVVVDSDLSVPGELDAVRVEVTGPSDTSSSVDQPLGAPGSPELPLTLGVSPKGDSLGPVRVVAVGLLDGAEVVRRSARTTLVRGETRVLHLILSGACTGIGCGDGQTCVNGGCVDEAIDPEDLPTWTGRPPGFDGGGAVDGGPDGDVDGGPADSGCVNDSHCDDELFCNGIERCVEGRCAEAERPVDCDDRVACTVDSCDEGADACAHVPDDSSCDAAPGGTCDATTDCQYPVCSAATCVAGPCQTATCSGETCVRTNLCGGSEMCCGGACVRAGCDDGNSCTDDLCGPSGCVHANNADPCSDGSLCTVGDVCSDGACARGATRDCNDGNVCTMDSCSPSTGCLYSNNTISCDDGDPCTANDRCSGGTCSGGTAGCDDGNPCTTDTCGATGCVYVDNTASCDDGNACTSGDTCSGGTCSGTAVSCDDGNECTDDSCSPSSGCVYTNNTAPCDDGSICTSFDRCSGGACTGTDPCESPCVCNPSTGACEDTSGGGGGRICPV